MQIGEINLGDLSAASAATADFHNLYLHFHCSGVPLFFHPAREHQPAADIHISIRE